MNSIKPQNQPGIASVFLTVFTIAVLMISACKKEQSKPEYPQGSNEKINSWVLDSLKRYYYWNDHLPQKADFSQAPLQFFNSIKNNSDRFSRLYLPEDLSTIPVSTRSLYGFDYAVIQGSANLQPVALVKFVLKDSPAARYGLKRGDYISRINGQRFTATNISTLEKDLLNGRTATIGMAEFKDGIYNDTIELNMIAGLTFEQPAVHQILESESTKTGYIYIDSFSPGISSSLIPVFTEFKNQGISELVLDLRYNSGGDVSEAAALCTMIAPGINYNSPFITYRGNKNGGIRNESFGVAATFDHQVNFNALLSANISLKRIFILATGATASASEVVINNLKPYLQVVLVGAKTMGKDEASFLIQDLREPKKVAWEMYPIIYKLSNASGQGGYAAGIEPDLQVSEFSQLPLLPFGNVNDPLISMALKQFAVQKKTGAVNRSASAVAVASVAMIYADTHIRKSTGSIVLTHR